jgi:hypothetical protein
MATLAVETGLPNGIRQLHKRACGLECDERSIEIAGSLERVSQLLIGLRPEPRVADLRIRPARH